MISLVIMLVVLSLGLMFVDVELTDRFSTGQGIYAWTIVMGIMFYIALLVNQTTRNFVTARHQLQEKNTKVMEQAEELEAIGKVARLVNSTLDINQVMKTISERLTKLFSFTQTAILFLDKEKQTLNLDRLGGDLPEGLKDTLHDLSIPLTEKNSAFALTVIKEVPIYLPDVAKDVGATEGNSAEIYKILPAKSLLTFPLIKDDEVFGVLAFANTENHFQLGQEDIEHIGRYVTYVVSALGNASDYRKIRESSAAADVANQAKSQFLANMSHELRTPMNAVIGYSEMLEEEAEDQGLDEMVADLRKVLSASRHLLQLINDVLDLSKVEAGKLELYPEKFTGDALLADIEATATPLVEKNKNELLLEKINEPGELYLDQTKLRQIILNLLSNAAKFTHEGTIRLRCERTRHDDEDWLEIDVEDSGLGMTEEQLERVFDPFSQAEATTTREYGGTGLGLSISRRLCETMGGSLTARSELGAGSTFSIRLPAQSGSIPEKLT
jgi:signal transduction histidine kinase/flagellin-specific chaperone FliS